MTFRIPIGALVLLGALALLPGPSRAAPGNPAPAATTADTPQARVSVHYDHPHDFTESRISGAFHGYDHGHYLEQLKSYLIKRATPMLKTGQHLSVTITNIRLAGDYEPMVAPNWQNVRIMRDIYPPRIHLQFQWTGADGQRLRSGSRKLIGMGYLQQRPIGVAASDPLYYDKALLGRWLRGGPDHW